MENTYSVYVKVLVCAQEYKALKVNAKLVGVDEALTWNKAVEAIRLPAYTVRSARRNSMSAEADAPTIDQSALYAAIRTVLDLIGEVNGARLNPKNLAEEFIAQVVRINVIDLTPEMAEARYDLRKAKADKADDDVIKACKNEIARLESLPGQCHKEARCLTATSWKSVAEKILSDAITKQTMKSAEEVAAEELAAKAERAAKAKARAKTRKANKA